MFRKVLAPLVWLAGLAMIAYYAPVTYRTLPLAPGEQVAGFLGESHELVTVGEGHALEAGVYRFEVNSRHAIMANDGSLLPFGHSMYVRDIGSRARRKLKLVGVGAIYDIACCRSAPRLCIQHSAEEPSHHGDRFKLSIVSGQDGQLIRTIDLVKDSWSISDDGTRLAYLDVGDFQAVCLDIDTGRLLYRVPAFGGTVSANGRYLVLGVDGDAHQIIIDLDHRQPVTWLTELNGGVDAIALHCGRVIDRNGKVWQTSPVRMIDDGHIHCTFVGGGKKIAWLERTDNGTKMKWRSVESAAKPLNGEVLIPEYSGLIGMVASQGNLIHFDGTRNAPEPAWWRQLLGRLGLMQAEPGLLDYHQWLLVDVRTGTIVHRGKDYLRAVSADGRYAITGDDQHPEVRIYELPLRRSMLFIAIAGGAWAALSLIMPWWWRKHVYGNVGCVSSVQESNAATTAAKP